MFESLRLRSYKNPPQGGFFVERRRVLCLRTIREGFERRNDVFAIHNAKTSESCPVTLMNVMN